jgi:hypothetical protein
MRYRIRPALWQALAADERSLSWLARQVGYTPQRVQVLHTHPEAVVFPRFAEAAAAVLGMEINELFEPVVPRSEITP